MSPVLAGWQQGRMLCYQLWGQSPRVQKAQHGCQLCWPRGPWGALMTAEHSSAQEECRPFLLEWKASAINSLFNSLHPGPERLQPACIPLFFALLKKDKSCSCRTAPTALPVGPLAWGQTHIVPRALQGHSGFLGSLSSLGAGCRMLAAPGCWCRGAGKGLPPPALCSHKGSLCPQD